MQSWRTKLYIIILNYLNNLLRILHDACTKQYKYFLALDAAKYTSGVHSASLIDCITPNVKDWLGSSNDPAHKGTNCNANPHLKFIERMFVYIFQFIIHLCCKINQVTKMGKLVFFFTNWGYSPCSHIWSISRRMYSPLWKCMGFVFSLVQSEHWG